MCVFFKSFSFETDISLATRDDINVLSRTALFIRACVHPLLFVSQRYPVTIFFSGSIAYSSTLWSIVRVYVIFIYLLILTSFSLFQRNEMHVHGLFNVCWFTHVYPVDWIHRQLSAKHARSPSSGDQRRTMFMRLSSVEDSSILQPYTRFSKGRDENGA